MRLRQRLSQSIDFIRKNEVVREPPLEWMVETTNRCNLVCPMCPRGSVSFDLAGMSFESFEKHLRAHPDVEAIWLYGFGEPLMDPKIFDFIRMTKKLKRQAALSTNATLLDEERGRALLDSGLDYLLLPVDGVVKETYEANRLPAVFDRVQSQIERFLQMKRNLHSRLHVTVQMIRMRNNQHEAGAFRRKWRRPGVNTVRVRDDLSGKPETSPVSQKQPSSKRRPCFFLWRGPLFVQAAGTVIPCPYYHGSPPFGNLRDQNALQIWNSVGMKQLRLAHVKGDLSKYPTCDRCPRYQPSRLIAIVSFFLTTWHIRRILPRIEDFQRLLGWKLFE